MSASPTSKTDNAKAAVIETLQQRLSDAIDLVAQAKQAHWNVKGPNFASLHPLFDQVYEEASAHMDLIAERLVALGGQAVGTVQSASKQTSLPHYPELARAEREHIDALSQSLATFSENTQKAIAEAEEYGDPVTADIYTGISGAVDKSHWMVSAYLG